jgi:hypothetical protein
MEMSDMKFACPHCNQHLDTPEELRGTVVECPSCGKRIQAPPVTPPKLEPASTYRLIGGDGKQYGPVTADQLRRWMSEGRVDRSTRVQVAGTAEWKPLGELGEFGAAPSVNSPAPLQSPSSTSQPVATAASPHQLTAFPVAAAILLHYMTFGLFTLIWLNLMHGKMRRVRADDPSAGRAVGFCFIPFFNLYWIFFTYRRLCLRVDEQRELYGLPPSNLRGLATTACILQIIPYVNFLFSYLLITPIFIGMMQSSVNRLAHASATTAPRNTLPASAAPARGMSGGVVAAIVCACMIPFIGLLAAIAIPSFVKARTTSQRYACVNNLRQLDAAKEQAALDQNVRNGDKITEQEVSTYLKKGFAGLVCPKGGRYEINAIGEDPSCSEHGSLSAAAERR